MATVSNLVACPIVFFFFGFEILVDMGGVLEYMRNGKS